MPIAMFMSYVTKSGFKIMSHIPWSSVRYIYIIVFWNDVVLILFVSSSIDLKVLSPWI